jgi:hypothetical protein
VRGGWALGHYHGLAGTPVRLGIFRTVRGLPRRTSGTQRASPDLDVRVSPTASGPEGGGYGKDTPKAGDNEPTGHVERVSEDDMGSGLRCGFPRGLPMSAGQGSQAGCTVAHRKSVARVVPYEALQSLWRRLYVRPLDKTRQPGQSGCRMDGVKGILRIHG